MYIIRTTMGYEGGQYKADRERHPLAGISFVTDLDTGENTDLGFRTYQILYEDTLCPDAPTADDFVAELPAGIVVTYSEGNATVVTRIMRAPLSQAALASYALKHNVSIPAFLARAEHVAKARRILLSEYVPGVYPEGIPIVHDGTLVFVETEEVIAAMAAHNDNIRIDILMTPMGKVHRFTLR